jgi:pyoverdine/dityrosine biosynthesis protein Dit1
LSFYNLCCQFNTNFELIYDGFKAACKYWSLKNDISDGHFFSDIILVVKEKIEAYEEANECRG